MLSGHCANTEVELLSPGVRASARTTACAIGERLLAEMDAEDHEDPNHERYANRSLNGPPGFALAFMALACATKETRFERAMHAQLRRAAGAGRSLDLGLIGGVSGLRAVAALATSLEPRYARLAAQCDEYVDGALPARRADVRYGEYDLIFGWSGIRLARSVATSAPRDELVARLFGLLGDERRWRTTDPFRPFDAPANVLGMAHGIAGVLATLATTVDDLSTAESDAIAECSHALAAQAIDAGGAYVWPREKGGLGKHPYRAVWCSGSLGIATCLLRVAAAVGDATLERFAVETLLRVAAQPRAAWLMMEHGLCHGTVGNAMVFAGAARRTGIGTFANLCNDLTGEAVASLRRHGMRFFPKGFDGRRYDALGELNGIAGIATALLTLCGDFSPAWTRLHALAW